jgi:hypothetical protein
LFRTTFLIRFDEKGMKGNQKGRKMKEEEDEKESDGDET